MSKNDDLCRVTLHNAKGCDDWSETMWAAYGGPCEGGHRVVARNHSVGSALVPPDSKAPAWGDTFVAVGARGSHRRAQGSGRHVHRGTLMTPRTLLLFLLGCLDLAIGLAVEALAYFAQMVGGAVVT